MKKIVALLLAVCLSLSLVACTNTEEAQTTNEPVTLRLLVDSRYEEDANVIADQLRKAGFEVDTEISPSLSDRITTATTGEFDLEYSGWTTGTANPDYSISSLYTSTSSVNHGALSDPYIDELAALAASQTAEEYMETYKTLEEYLVGEMAYVIPLYQTMSLHVFNNTVIDGDSIKLRVASSQPWNTYDYADESLRQTRTLTMGINNSGVISHLDPTQVNDTTVAGTTSYGNTRLVTLNEEDKVSVDNALSLSFAIAEGNQEYYFLLRDDIYFAKVENGQAVDTGVRVGGEDAIFSILRAADPNSVPSNKVSPLFTYVDTMEIVSDMGELNDMLDSDTGESILDSLQTQAGVTVSSLAEDKTAADNANGTYQVVKLTTKEPYPQILNMLTHTGASILSQEQVTALNGEIDLENYDRSTDILYGDFNAIKNVENHLWSSGPYVVQEITDYGVTFVPNPGYMVNSQEDEVLIDNIEVKFFSDADSMLNSYRSGELDYLAGFDETKLEVLQEEATNTVLTGPSARVEFLTVNMRENSNLLDQDLRLAVLYALDPNVFVEVKNNLVAPAYSTVSSFIGNPNTISQDLEKSAEHLQLYYDKLAAE